MPQSPVPNLLYQFLEQQVPDFKIIPVAFQNWNPVDNLLGLVNTICSNNLGNVFWFHVKSFYVIFYICVHSVVITIKTRSSQVLTRNYFNIVKPSCIPKRSHQPFENHRGYFFGIFHVTK